MGSNLGMRLASESIIKLHLKFHTKRRATIPFAFIRKVKEWPMSLLK